jgi:hypothetical protein
VSKFEQIKGLQTRLPPEREKAFHIMMQKAFPFNFERGAIA